MGSIENLAYAVAYFGLSAVLLLALGLTAVHARATRPYGGQGLVALGLLVTLVAGVGFDLAKASLGDLVYLQVHFSVFYAAFAIVVRGLDRVVVNASPERRPPWRWLGWAAVGLAIVVALGVLWLAPDLYRTTGVGGTRYVQLPLFYAPLVLTLLVGGLALAPSAIAGRAEARWAEFFLAASLIGVLREAGILPPVGEPLVDVLTIFGPLTLGGLALYVSQRASLVAI